MLLITSCNNFLQKDQSIQFYYMQMDISSMKSWKNGLILTACHHVKLRELHSLHAPIYISCVVIRFYLIFLPHSPVEY